MLNTRYRMEEEREMWKIVAHKIKDMDWYYLL